jgi:hypothetical protein
MTKTEVLAKLAEKLDANRAEVRRQLEFLCSLPGHHVHSPIENTTPDGLLIHRTDLLAQLSTTWKEGRALQEVAAELVGLVYPDAPPDTQRLDEHNSNPGAAGFVPTLPRGIS